MKHWMRNAALVTGSLMMSFHATAHAQGQPSWPHESAVQSCSLSSSLCGIIQSIRFYTVPHAPEAVSFGSPTHDISTDRPLELDGDWSMPLVPAVMEFSDPVFARDWSRPL